MPIILRCHNFKKVLSLISCVVLTIVMLASSIQADVPSASIQSFPARSMPVSEIEPNDSYDKAQTIYSDCTISGTIGAQSGSSEYVTSDRDDWYKVVFPISGYANFRVGEIPSYCDIDLMVLDSNFNQVGSSNTKLNAELISDVAVSANTVYYIQVYTFNNTSSKAAPYKLRTKIRPTSYAIFDQYHMTGFTTTNLNKMYQKSNYSDYVNDDNGFAYLSQSWYERINNGGCIVSSFAMMLKNMGKKTTSQKFDVRTGTTGYLSPDPVTVAYANMNSPTFSNNGTIYYTGQSSDPVTIQSYSRIASSFGATMKTINVSSYTSQKKADLIAYLLTRYPQGVAGFYGTPKKNHTLVYLETTHEVSSSFTIPSLSYVTNSGETIINRPITLQSMRAYEVARNSKSISSSEFGSEFTVMDPVTNKTELFDSSWTASNYGWNALYQIYVFE